MKIVMIVNNELPLGLAANACAVLGISLGRREKGILGPAITDRSGAAHYGITHMNIPVLAADGDGLKGIYARAADATDVEIIDFNTIAQECRDYTHYRERLSATPTEDLCFSGLCLAGPPKKINGLTGSLGLFR